MTSDLDDRTLLRELVRTCGFVLGTAQMAIRQEIEPSPAFREIIIELVHALGGVGMDLGVAGHRSERADAPLDLAARREIERARHSMEGHHTAVLGRLELMATLTDTTCPRCGDSYTKESDEDFGQLVCGECRPLFPLSLLKATADPFDYALRLRTGEEIRFSTAEIHGDYVTIGGMVEKDGERPLDAEQNPKLQHRFYRGLDIRVQDIVWCADAPDGS